MKPIALLSFSKDIDYVKVFPKSMTCRIYFSKLLSDLLTITIYYLINLYSVDDSRNSYENWKPSQQSVTGIVWNLNVHDATASYPNILPYWKGMKNTYV